MTASRIFERQALWVKPLNVYDMRTMISYVMLFLALSSSSAWDPPQSTRRKAFLQISAAWGVCSKSAAEAAAPPPKYLRERGSEEKPPSPCYGQPVKKNCWSTEDTGSRRLERWVPPKDVAAKGAAAILKDLEETIAVYPQEGQSDVDRGGWKEAQRGSSNGITYIRYEFQSGRFKYIDDLEIRVDADGTVSARSASREGGYDYEVNRTRLNYISSLLRKKGWQAKDV